MIKVSYEVIVQAGEDCKKTGGELEAAFEQLKSQLNPLISTWEGDAMAAWEARQQEWYKALDEMKALLARIAIALPEIADGYQQTDAGVGNMFS